MAMKRKFKRNLALLIPVLLVLIYVLIAGVQHCSAADLEKLLKVDHSAEIR